MSHDEIRATVGLSSRLRMPQFSPDDRPKRRIDKLCDHMLDCATNRGLLEEAWSVVTRMIGALEETLMKVPVSHGRTAGEREQIRQLNDPATWGALRDARQLKSEIERQIHRLTKDEATASRAYTFITGNA